MNAELPLADYQRRWENRRDRLARELRVLIVDGDATTRKQIDDLLFRMRVPARAVGSAKHALEIIERDRSAIVVSAATLPDMEGLLLLRTLRERHPLLELVLAARKPSLPLITRAFDLGIVDILDKPFSDPSELQARLEKVIQRSLDRRMRTPVIEDLRDLLTALPEENQRIVTSTLKRRLAAYKKRLGLIDRVLVVEGNDVNLRLLSEHIVLIGLRVETAAVLADALTRLRQEKIHVVIADTTKTHGVIPLRDLIQNVIPDIEIIATANKPTAQEAQEALRAHVAAYIPWPPTSLSHLAGRTRKILHASRQDHLVDNLLVELYRTIAEATGTNPHEGFAAFQKLIGLTEELTATDEIEEGPASTSSPSETIQKILTGMIDDLDRTEQPIPAPIKGDERRGAGRIVQNQLLRFRRQGDPTAHVAYLGDLSVGGIFIRTDHILSRDTPVSVDFNVEHEGQRYRVESEGVVAWLAHEAGDSPHGAGFGVRFVGPPPDVTLLMKEIVAARGR
ncbi:MAG: response regulator [Deltaproteobacteria bacterium]|nr:response regulator [Deltaproteobacteria bacterium]